MKREKVHMNKERRAGRAEEKERKKMSRKNGMEGKKEGQRVID